MRTAAISLLVAVALTLAACGSSLAGPEGIVSEPDPTAPPSTTTTVADTDTDGDPTAPDQTSTPDSPATTTTTAPPTTTTIAPDPTDSAGDTEVLVYLISEPGTDSQDYGCGHVTAVPRLVESPRVLAGAIEVLLAGPNDAELAAGYGSWFSPETGWELASVTISDAIAYIDLTEDSDPIPNASTSCGSMALFAQLDMTATQFPSVERAVYSIGGDMAAFYHWFERDVPDLG